MSMLAVSTGGAILIGIGSGIVVLLAGAATLVALRRPRRPRGADLDIPAGMQPGPADPELEKPLLEKAYAWGALLVIFMAIWIPVVWLTEADTNAADLEEFAEISVERGRLTTLEGNEENQLGFNCERCHGEGLTGGQNLFNGSIVPVPELLTVCGGADFGHPLITSVDDVIEVIAQGRPGTDMPSWSVRFAGAMHDQQIEDVVNYILSIQEVPDEQNVCLNPAAAEASPSPGGEASPSPTP